MLSAAPLTVISRLSYGVYLIHFLFYFLSNNAERERKYSSVYNAFSESASVFVWSSMLALTLFLACEAPVGRLDKIIWGQSTPKPKEENRINGMQDQEQLPPHTQTKEVP
ncbi:hypothetical protein HPB52_020431 [Rhipicephalus sanguineus]|uniref:Acyltransferase n=1 Tax=Rhipicephalus sanguineus TaxID=34632 RepID=A0A9D4TBP2_RHISA|nr:hypothetical protein HPB52_020431 [Rhipicephalus sanguineus]